MVEYEGKWVMVVGVRRKKGWEVSGNIKREGGVRRKGN